jgi:ectoine hydroxylase
MKLTPSQLNQFERDGWLMLENLFSAEEVATLMDDVPRIFALRRDEVVREKDGETPRSAFAAQTYSDPFRRLGRHPRLIEPVQKILDGPVYLHQFKVNAKAAFDGDVWQWHQDYGTWQRDDGMPEPRALNIALFLEDVTTFNGPLMFIPGSHNDGVLGAGHDTATTSYPLWTLDQKTVAALANEKGMVAPLGKAGSVLMFHSNLVHGSPGNMSPFSRTIVYISACHVDNHIRQFNRPKWIAHRDFTAIECLPDDCLS